MYLREAAVVLMTEEEALPFFEQALKDGVQIATHAIGDRGNTLVLDWYEKAFAAVPPAERKIAEPRWRIEHAQILDTDDIARFKRLGVIASMQPPHPTPMMSSSSNNSRIIIIISFFIISYAATTKQAAAFNGSR